jgi:hypothetical protein
VQSRLGGEPAGARALLLTLAVLASALGACGGGSPEGVEPAAWASDVCARLGNWLDQLTTRRDELATAVANAPNVGEAKVQIVAYFTDAIGNTDALITGLRALDQPAVSDGDELHEAFVAEVGMAVGAFREGKTGAEALAVEDIAVFGKAAETLFAQVAGAGPRIDLALRKVLAEHRAEELGEAFTSAPKCKVLSASATTTSTSAPAPTLPAD